MTDDRLDLAISIDFEGFAESMEESFEVPVEIPRHDVEPELDANADRCLDLLERHGVKATFFVLGWIAERFPTLVRRIADAGHEIGSHSFDHRRLFNLPANEAEGQVRRSREILTETSGQTVFGFRAPDFSLRPDATLLDILVDCGYRYDSSAVATDLHDVYGGWSNRAVHRLGNGLLEFPIPTHRIAPGVTVPVGGGGWFRLFPGWMSRRWLAACPDRVTYLHPYEIGGHFPTIPMPPLRRFRHTWNNGKLDGRLATLFERFRPMPIVEYLERHHGLARVPAVSTR